MFCLKNLLDLLIKLQNTVMKKMSLEERKTELEIKKLEDETGWFKKIVESITTISTLITAFIAAGTLLYAIYSGTITNIVNKLEKDNSALKTEVSNLDSNINKLKKEKIAINSEIQKSKLELIILKEKYSKEKIRLSYDIEIQKMQVKSVNQKLIFTEDCYVKAQVFISSYCRYDPQRISREISPYKLRFGKTNEEIVDLKISNIDYTQFLQQFAGYTIDSNWKLPYQYIVSNDKSITINIGDLRRWDEYEGINRKNRIEQFECWKKLDRVQKLKILNQIVRR